MAVCTGIHRARIAGVVATLVSTIAQAPSAATMDVVSREELIACVEAPAVAGERSRECRVPSPIEGSFSFRLAAEAPTTLRVRCLAEGSLKWSPASTDAGVYEAFSVRIHPETKAGWRVEILGCDVSDRGPPGARTVQGPVVVNNGDVPGTFVLSRVSFVTRAYGPSTVGGGVNPNSTTVLRVSDSFVAAPICWDAKSRAWDDRPVPHVFVRNFCLVNDRPGILSPRALKIEGATEVFATDNVWIHGQVSQSHVNRADWTVRHVFVDDTFWTRGAPRLPRDSIFLAGADSEWLVTGWVGQADGRESINVQDSWAGADVEFGGSLQPMHVPEPDPWRGLVLGVALAFAVSRGLERRPLRCRPCPDSPASPVPSPTASS